MEVDPLTNEMEGTTTIRAAATGPLAAFNLDFQGLQVDEILVDGAPVRFAITEHELTIAPAQPLAKGSSFIVNVRYHGSPQAIPDVASGEFVMVGWFHDPAGAINVLSEPNGAASWFPSNDHPLDKATFRFDISVPDGWVVAAPGILREAAESGGLDRFVWEMDQPMATYLASINIDRYIVESSRGPDGVVIRNYLTSDVTADRRAGIDAIPEMLRFFSGLFGPYPFDEYGVVIASAGIEGCRMGFSAMEVQTMPVHCPTLRALHEITMAHELAHQWFGDSVSLKSWQDIWLKEGIATYASWMWMTRHGDLETLTQVARTEAKKYEHESLTGEPPPTELYDDEVYSGGALVFHALRLKVGDEAFFEILRAYLDRYRYGNAGKDEFLAISEEVSGQELSTFFDSWLMHAPQPGLPAP
jgi:aminopeptidase N